MTKKRLIVKLTKSIEVKEKTHLDLASLYGAWEDSRSSDETINDIKNSRVEKKDDTVKTEDDTLNDTVFSLIKQNKNITTNEISGQLKMSLSTVKRKIKDLRDQGKLKRTGSDKKGHCEIIEK